MGLHFYNWDGQKSCRPAAYALPADEEAVVDLVQAAYKQGDFVKVIGAGMSFSGAQLSANTSQSTGKATMMSLDNLDSIISIDMNSDGSAAVTVQAGMRVRTLCEQLDAKGLALLNLGATATQSIVGATQTGTHGTGGEIGGLASYITALRIVDSTGQVYSADADTNMDLFNAARTGVGALGIVTEITLTAVPQWKMQRKFVDMSFKTLMTQLPQMLEAHPRLQWNWTPYTDKSTVTLRDDVPWNTPLSPAPTTENGTDGGCWSTTQATTPLCVDVSHKTLTDSWTGYQSRTLYTEMEMFIPVELVPDAVKDFQSWTETVRDQYDNVTTISFMVRYVAQDDIFLSPMYGRDTAVLSFIASGTKTNANKAQPMFELFSKGLQSVCEQSKYAGRPHWGKVNWADHDTPDYLASVYPDTLAKFNSVRSTMDPVQMFTNDYLKQRIPTDEAVDFMATVSV
jgi:L-gulonolactone oxidase